MATLPHQTLQHQRQEQVPGAAPSDTHAKKHILRATLLPNNRNLLIHKFRRRPRQAPTHQHQMQKQALGAWNTHVKKHSTQPTLLSNNLPRQVLPIHHPQFILATLN